ncbi:MAG: hypothetical protein K9M03_02240 [Kiritimatiellales bacterium]|nr:hypothetical protein [Kiritimatiellales bacterium]
MQNALSFNGYFSIHEDGTINVHDISEHIVPLIAKGCIVIGAERARDLLLAEMRQPNMPRQTSEALLRAIGLLQTVSASVESLAMAFAHCDVFEALRYPSPEEQPVLQSA